MKGIRRAADAALAAMGVAAAMLRDAEIDGDRLLLSGALLTAEAVRERMREVCARAGAPAPPDIMVKPMGPNPAGGHDPGAGPLPPHVPIELDLWPRDERTGCWADMTRRSCAATSATRSPRSTPWSSTPTSAYAPPPRPGAPMRGPVRDRVRRVRGGRTSDGAHQGARRDRCARASSSGWATASGSRSTRTRRSAAAATRRLIAGDVIAVEPGTSVREVGGTRVEDLLLVTDDGNERLTGSFPYGLVP